VLKKNATEPKYTHNITCIIPETRENPHINTRRTNIASKSLRHKGPKIRYKIPNEIKAAKSLSSFAHKLKKFVIDNY